MKRYFLIEVDDQPDDKVRADVTELSEEEGHDVAFRHQTLGDWTTGIAFSAPLATAAGLEEFLR